MTTRALPVAAFLAFVAAAHPAEAATLGEALAAYRNNHVADAERQLGEVAADPAASAADRARAQRELARIDWLVRGDTEGIAAVRAGATPDAERCPAALLALRIYREARSAAMPLSEARDASTLCSPSDAETMHIELARSHLAMAAGAAPNDQAAHLAAAETELNAIDVAARAAPEVGGPRLSLAIAQRNAGAALEAWRSYFWLTDADAPQAMPTYAGRVEALFTAGLAPTATDVDIIALIEMLIRAGFVEDARLLADQTGVAEGAAGNPTWRRAAAFFVFDRAVRDITLRANREIATGGRAASYQEDISAAMGQLIQSAELSGEPRAALAEAYGIYGTLGETSGYPSMHGGHLVQDERIAVEQYGRRGELRFIVIDNMVANGFESWLWDGWAESGGWSGDGAIVQVRSAYTSGPLTALRRARPGPVRDAFIERNERTATEERATLGRDGIASVPATANRLELQALEQMVQRTGADDEAFIAENWRATNQYSIELHEGRHALDNAAGHFSTPDLEFRAKLSQIVLADYPRLALSNVVGSTIGDTPHGIGNRRVLEGYRRWMRRHRDEITGFDRNAPTLTQLDKLTDAQIVEAARSMDPWAR